MVLAILVAFPAAAQEPAQRTLSITPTGPQPHDGHYATTDDVEFLIDRRDGNTRLRFLDNDEVFYLTSEPSTLGGRLLKYDNGEIAVAVSGWGGVTLYTRASPVGTPAGRVGEAQSLDPPPVPADRITFFAARLSQRLADRQNLAIGFATNWDLLAEKDQSRALAADAMRNATYALEALSAARALRNALAARIHVVRLVEGPVQGVTLEGEVLEITYAPLDGPHARPSSRAIAEEVLRKL